MTAISGDIGNGVLKILKDTGDELYGCDVNRIAVGMDLVKVFWQSSYAVSPSLRIISGSLRKSAASTGSRTSFPSMSARSR